MKERLKLHIDAVSMWLQEGSYWDNGMLRTVTIEGSGAFFEIGCESGAYIRASGMCEKKHDNLYEIKITLKNNGDSALDTRFSYPYLLYGLGEPDIRSLDPSFGGVLDRFTWAPIITYPGHASFCLTVAASSNHAVACGLYNKQQWTTTIRNCTGDTEGHIRLTLEKLTLLPGETIELPVMFISWGSSWAEALAPYKAFIQEAFPPNNPQPEWMKNEKFTETRRAHCLAPFDPPEKAAGIWMFSEQGSIRTFEKLKDEIDKAVETGLQKGYKPLFYQFGWWKNISQIQGLYMFDSLCGDYTAAHDTAKRIVEYIHEVGCRTYLYTNAIAAGDETEVFKRKPELFVLDADHLPVSNDVLPMYQFCPSAPGIREYWDDVLKYILIDMDADGIFLDQICGAVPPALCYHPGHNHKNTYTYGTEILSLLEYIRSAAKILKPESCVMGELVLDSRSVWLDESHGYGYRSIFSQPPEIGDLLRDRVPSEQYIFTRYLCPDIHTQTGKDNTAVFFGAAGSYGTELWRRYAGSFESGVVPCHASPAGALAYLFGDGEHERVLAVKADCEIDEVVVNLPDGSKATVKAQKTPSFYTLTGRGASHGAWELMPGD